jgi:uncharacterized lipoprotein YddW (UPF0748 family)
VGRHGRQHRLAVAPGLPTADQQRELVAILDRAKALNLNAIVLQVRRPPTRSTRRRTSPGRST